ncbi:MAG: NAD(P)H-dependent oxidoreductase [Acidobacteria bacterium]|nr:NAD(P)H-dependent oxidoreductase [Acidobacteriota bacterium]
MAKILISYYSRTGNTEKMAKKVAEGATKEGAQVILKKITETTPDDLLEADGIIIGSPVYYGTMAAEVKRLFDDSVKYHKKLERKVGGAFASSAGLAGGNETTVLDILKAMLIHGMVIKGSSAEDHYGPVAVGAPDERSKENCLRLGREIARLAERLKGAK